MKSDQPEPPVKCVVWDLDDTLWEGVLLEDDEVTLSRGREELIKALDSRGILHSIASKNEHDFAMAELNRTGLWEYFLYPQINWNAKSASIKRISEALNIATDSILFIDDEEFERDEVTSVSPDVRCCDIGGADQLFNALNIDSYPVTEESRQRRQMYCDEQKRKLAEAGFEGPTEAFLATLGMELTIRNARDEDLERAEELTVRTNQLNSTGLTYSYEELAVLRTSPRHDLLIAELRDRYGDYGKTGLALIERSKKVWHLKLLLMSCRVMSKGIGSVLLNHIMHGAKDAGVRLQAAFIRNERNRRMLVTYKFAGFKEIGTNGKTMTLEHDLTGVRQTPEYVRLKIL